MTRLEVRIKMTDKYLLDDAEETPEIPEDETESEDDGEESESEE